MWRSATRSFAPLPIAFLKRARADATSTSEEAIHERDEVDRPRDGRASSKRPLASRRHPPAGEGGRGGWGRGGRGGPGGGERGGLAGGSGRGGGRSSAGFRGRDGRWRSGSSRSSHRRASSSSARDTTSSPWSTSRARSAGMS